MDLETKTPWNKGVGGINREIKKGDSTNLVDYSGTGEMASIACVRIHVDNGKAGCFPMSKDREVLI